MRAVRWHAAGDLRIDDIDEPTAGPDQVLIEVEACGICGTDLHEFRHGPVMIRSGPHPLTGAQPPITLGHEFSGTVAAVGDGVDDLRIGQLVTVDPCLRCGRCAACERGDYHLCARGGSVGLACDGALAEKVVVPRVQVVAVPDGVTARQAAVAEPLAVGLHAAKRADVTAGSSVLITGAGPIGIAALLSAAALGATQIFVSEPVPERAQLALSLGATEVFDPRTSDVRKEVFVRTGRQGPDSAIEATGHPQAFDLGLRSLRRGGTLAVAGISPSTIECDLRQVVLYERQVRGSLGYNRDIERVLGLIAARRLDPSPYLTRIAPLEDAPQWFELMSSGPHDDLKLLLTPRHGAPN
ncbi:alcohol dehydrogenase catalytic domain-containing protein [uncultured Aeromicrobium sp.]|uniref:alcohol dehydrogenase catalytic domain-containing protein n=1 Tax=uncultured Aeromicrobium sp. TaxID=337820 RepID=UPI0025E6C143|nr:alcohol dehydrogenase catalytic domain-containing protein [uncultured Aeromicrobium sp.]